MNSNEINTLLAQGLSIADIGTLMAAQNAFNAAQQPAPQVVQQAPVMAQPVQQPTPQPVQPVQVQPVQPAAAPQQDFTSLLASIGAAMQQPTNIMPAYQQPTPQPVQQPAAIAQNQPATTPANAGITPEEATKLFQAWSMGQATQNIELPPSADEVLEKRFKTLFGADTSKPTK